MVYGRFPTWILGNHLTLRSSWTDLKLNHFSKFTCMLSLVKKALLPKKTPPQPWKITLQQHQKDNKTKKKKNIHHLFSSPGCHKINSTLPRCEKKKPKGSSSLALSRLQGTTPPASAQLHLSSEKMPTLRGVRWEVLGGQCFKKNDMAIAGKKPSLRISDWTLQKRGVWLCMTRVLFESPNHQALEIPWFLGIKVSIKDTSSLIDGCFLGDSLKQNQH